MTVFLLNRDSLSVVADIFAVTMALKALIGLSASVTVTVTIAASVAELATLAAMVVAIVVLARRESF
jgi:collagenase-like PrtC family protease